MCKKCLNKVIRQRNVIKLWNPNTYWIPLRYFTGIFSSANSSSSCLPKLIFVDHLLRARHHVGIWRYSAELDLVLAQDPWANGRYRLATVGGEVLSVSTSSPRVSGALALFMAVSPELAQGLCWIRRSVNDLGLFGSFQVQNRVRCPHPTRPLQEGFTPWFQGIAVSRTDLSEKRWQGTAPQVWLLNPFCGLRPFGHLGKPVNPSHNNF